MGGGGDYTKGGAGVESSAPRTEDNSAKGSAAGVFSTTDRGQLGAEGGECRRLHFSTKDSAHQASRKPCRSRGWDSRSEIDLDR